MLLALLLILAGLAGAIAPQTAAAEVYTIEVGGVQITSENAANITGPNITGKVSFDESTHTLILNNATIDGGSGSAIAYDFVAGNPKTGEGKKIVPADGITIRLQGNNTLKSGLQSTISAMASIRITGGGSLTIESGNKAIEVFVDKGVSNLTIDGCTLTANRRVDVNGSLQINNSNVNVEDRFTGYAFQVLKGITLSGCKIVSPAGGKIKQVKSFLGLRYTVLTASGDLAQEVIIGTGNGPKPTLTLNPKELEGDASAQKKKVTLTSDVPVHINRVSAPGWIDWSEESGESYSKSYTLTISFEANTGGKREDVITFHTTEGDVTLKVTQEGGGTKPEPEKLTLNPEKLEVDASAQKKKVTLTSDVPVHINRVSAPGWIDWSEESGESYSKSYTLTISFEANTGGKREDVITFKTTGGDVTLKVTQEGKKEKPEPKPQEPEPTLTVSATSVTFPPEGGDPKIIPVKSSHGWSVERDVSKGTGDWITFGEQPEGLYISVEENTGTRQRAVQLFVISDKNLKNGQPLKRTVLVTQQAKKLAEAVSGLSINPASMTMGSGGGMVGFNVYASKGWTISGSPDWMHPDATRGSGTRLVIVRFDRNESGAERTGKLTVKSDDGKAERTFTLTQRAGQRKPTPSPGSTPSEEYDYDLALNPEEITVGPSDGAGSSISVATSRLWAGSTTEDWIRLESAVGRGNGSFTFSLAANPSKEMRHGTITVRTQQGMDELKVAIHQQGRVGDEEAPTRVKVSSVSLDPSSITVNGDLSTTLISAIVSPDNARNKGLLWMSSNASVATVQVFTPKQSAALPQLRFAPDADDYALVTIVGKGKATITAATSDGSGIVARCEVNVLSTVANTVPYAPQAKVYTVGPTLYLSLPTAETVQVYTLAGTLYRTWQAPAGDTSLTLPAGTYIIKVGQLTEKVVVR